MAKKLFEVFKAGTHTAMNGSSKTWTEEDLDNIVQKYSESEHDAPLVVGHPKINAPAYGWVKNLVRKGKVLFAEARDVAKEFAEAVNDKHYPKRSIALYGDGTLKHIGFLGAQPPAVKGLADFNFAEEHNDDSCFEFGEEGVEFTDYHTAISFNSVGRTLRGIRDLIIEKFSIDEADKAINKYLLSDLENFKADPPDGGLDSFSEKEPVIMAMTKEEEAKMKGLEDQVSAFSEKETALETRATNAESALDKIKKDQIDSDINSFCDSMISEGKLKAGDKVSTIETMQALQESTRTMEFGEGDKKKTVSVLDNFKKGIESREPSVEFSEFAKNNGDKKLNVGEKELNQFSEMGDVSEEDATKFKRISAIESEKGCTFAEALDFYSAEQEA